MVEIAIMSRVRCSTLQFRHDGPATLLGCIARSEFASFFRRGLLKIQDQKPGKLRRSLEPAAVGAPMRQSGVINVIKWATMTPFRLGCQLALEQARMDKLSMTLAELVRAPLSHAIALVLFVLTAYPAEANEADYIEGDRGKAIQNYVNRLHQRLGFSGVVLAAREGKIIAMVARGPSNDGSDNDRLTTESLFEIASCTKPFTAIAILQLCEKGKLSLSDPIAQHLPDIPSHSRAITIRQLLAHTSGIPGSNTLGSGTDVSKVIPTFLRGGPKHEPGEHFEYWNQGYALLSEIVALTSGQSYTDYLRENIFQRSGMTSSCFTGDPQPAGSSVAVGSSSRGNSRSALDHPYGSYGFQYRGMGGLVTNVRDLWNWDRSLCSGELIGGDSLDSMISAGPGGYGLGWFITRDPDGASYHRHGGSVRGFLAEVRRYPSIDGSVFILANQDESLPFSLMKWGVERILFGQADTILIPKPPSPDFVDSVVGEYEDAKKRKLTIQKSPGLPSLRIKWGGPVTAGYLGLDNSGQPRLYLLVRSSGELQFKDDGALEFSGTPVRMESVSLLAIKPKLTFRRLSP